MVQQVRFLVENKSLTVDRHVVGVSVYVRNLLRNLVDNDDDDDDDSSSDSESESESDESFNENKNNIKNNKRIIDIPIDNISYDTMELVLRWCKHFYETHRDEIEQGYSYSNLELTNSNTSNNNSNNNYNSSDDSFNSNGNKDINGDLNSEIGNWPDNIMDDYQSRMSGPVLDMWEREFLDVDAETLKSIILASNFLNIKPLLDTACKIIAELFRGKSPREIINAFNAAHA